jgi:hypothetical protein
MSYSDIYRRSLEFFVGSNAIDIDISRPQKNSTPGGGWRFDRSAPTIISGQQVRFVRQSDTRPRINPDGRVESGNPYIVGAPDLDIEDGDRFSVDDVIYEVKWISRSPQWRVTAEVARVG